MILNMWEDLARQFYLDLDICIRLALTLIAAFLLGLDRERQGRAAGLRTILLVSLAACVIMLVSEYYYVRTFDLLAANANSWRPDPTRLAAGALSGMGFLGAGVIIHERSNVVRGVTTAATLWFSSAIGLSFGAGVHGVGVICTLLAFVILFWLPRLERFVQDDWFTEFSVTVDTEQCSMDQLEEAIRAQGVTIMGLDLKNRPAARERRAIFHLKHRKSRQTALAVAMTDALAKLPGVRQTHWRD